jgi:hypothetical protein
MLDVWEDPALLIGVPLLVLGGLGMLVVVGALVSYWIRPT